DLQYAPHIVAFRLPCTRPTAARRTHLRPPDRDPLGARRRNGAAHRNCHGIGDAMLNDNDRWILSYYRSSEISGAMFFARLARSIRQPAIQRDLTKHFADESQHAWYWSQCLEQLEAKPIRVTDAYQDQYFEAVGLPANLMEVLAITQVFERRTINHYAR